jgi:serine protein kinase
MARLTGSVDEAVLSEDRLDYFGKAYRLNGELNAANRGIMEFVEIFKLDEKFLSVLLVLTEEQKIKAPGYGTIYADEVILAHSNEAEYTALVKDKKTEALQDRIMVVRVPYNLRVSEELQIYNKMLNQVDLKNIPISPLCLKVVSTFAVLSRLERSDRFGMSPVKKMHLYDGQYVEGYTLKDIEELHEASPREGYIGISPRFVINQIARAIARPGTTCLDPLDLLQILWGGLQQSTSLAQEERSHLYNLFLDTRKEYDRLAVREVQKAFVDQFEKSASGIIQKYYAHLENYVLNQNDEARRTFSGWDEPGERAMNSLERYLGIQDNAAGEYRRDLYQRLSIIRQAGQEIDCHADPRLEEAAIHMLCPGAREVQQVIEEHDPAHQELLEMRNRVLERLIRERGYERDCAESLLKYVAGVLTDRKSYPSLPKALRWLHG